jgi:hypothetical protein
MHTQPLKKEKRKKKKEKKTKSISRKLDRH